VPYQAARQNSVTAYQCFGLAARTETIQNHGMASKIDLWSETSEKNGTAEFVTRFQRIEILMYSSKQKNKTKNKTKKLPVCFKISMCGYHQEIVDRQAISHLVLFLTV